jgi:hypothetical protein
MGKACGTLHVRVARRIITVLGVSTTSAYFMCDSHGEKTWGLKLKSATRSRYVAFYVD